MSAVLLITALSALGPSQEFDTRPDRFMGPPRKVTLLAYPVEGIIYAASGAPQLPVEVQVDLKYGWALTVRPLGIWYPPTETRREHGGGIGAALGVHWYTHRSLTGPYLAIQGGLVEAFLGDDRGRIFGATFIFGYGFGWDNGATLNLGLGLGYWHRAGALDTGVQWPEILSFRVGTGWSWGTGSYSAPYQTDGEP